MFKGRLSFVLAAVLLALPGLVQSATATTVISSTFDGSEPRTAPLPGTCGGDVPLAYVNAGDLRVAVTGVYTVYDALGFIGSKYPGVDVSALIYQGPFDVNNPGRNLVTTDGIDDLDIVNLQAGVAYTLVVQQWCENREGAWGLTISGPGEITSARAVTPPELTNGVFASTDPTATTVCSAGQYHATGPMSVSRTGIYQYTDVSYYANFFDVCVLVYEGAFDPAQPDLNRVPATDFWSPDSDFLDDDGSVYLEAGKQYTFVVQPLGVAAVGDYFFVLAPPAPFRINKALAGAWFDPGTPGQGFFFDVYENIDLLFGGWYTFDLQRPVDGTADLGEPGHRWLTIQGNYDGAQAESGVFLARGGVFDAPEPGIETPQPEVGTATVEFTDCISGTVDYDLTDPAVSGSIPIIPLTDNHVELCESLTQGPGVPDSL